MQSGIWLTLSLIERTDEEMKDVRRPLEPLLADKK